MRYPINARTIKTPSAGKSFVRLTHIRQCYDFIRVIGYGKFGVVREAVDKSITSGRKFSVAIKSIPKNKLKTDVSVFMRELKVLQELDHPNIIKVYETFEDEKYFHLVMELCDGGDLLERILDKGVYPEPEAAEIMKKMMLAVNHMHNSFISHRDLKPENILYAGTEIKIGDFGISSKFGNATIQEMKSVVGTPHYVAPEVLTRRYGKECDVWSLGVILFVLLSGRMPFDGDDINEILTQIIRAGFTFNDSSWKDISQDAKHLITKMLTVEPADRITIQGALDHRWFKNCIDKPASRVPKKLVEMLKQKKASSMLSREAMKIIVKHLPGEAIAQLNDYFTTLDPLCTGFITAEGLRDALYSSGYSFAVDEIVEIVSKNDFLGQGRIKYSDFLIATMDRRSMIDEENLWIAFKYFDVEETGRLTLNSIHSSLVRAGCEVYDEDMQFIRDEFRIGQDDAVDFERFKQIMVVINSKSPDGSEGSSPLIPFMDYNSGRRLSSEERTSLRSLRNTRFASRLPSRVGTIKRSFIAPTIDETPEPFEPRPDRVLPTIVLKPVIDS